MSDLLQSPPVPPSWTDRLALLRAAATPGRVALALAGAVAAVILGLIFLRTPSRQPELVLPKAGDPPPASGAVPGPAATGPGATGPGGSAPSSTVAGVGVVTVHAAGQVAAPGVYSVPAGARVADLVIAAGGLLPEADVDRLNLAARVVDGTRVYIPRRGEVPPAEGAVGDPGAAAGAPGGGAGGAAGPVDLNTATAAQLDTLPGVGPATAAAILTYRSRHGRFKSVTELLDVPGIGPAKLEALRPLVVVS